MREIITIIEYFKRLTEVNIDTIRNSITFPLIVNAQVISLIRAFGINIDNVGVDIVEIDINSLNFTIFLNNEDFISRVTKNVWSKPLALFNEGVIYFPDIDKAYNLNQEEVAVHLISNNYYYYSLLDFLKTQEHQENSAFYFVDYFNLDTKHIVFTSLKKDGKIEIVLPNGGINLMEDVRLGYALKEFKEAFKENNKHFPKFIKIELINELSKVNKSERINLLLRKFNDIIYTASQNFEIYLHDLSLENLKNDFIEYKNKYFLLLRESLSKLTNQIIGLPIIISASILGTYKISDSPISVFVVTSVFIIYMFYSIYLLKLQKEDIVDLKNTFNSDFMKLAKHDYFKKFPNDLAEFSFTKRNLSARFRSIIGAIDLYFFFFSISSMFFLLYLEYQLGIRKYELLVSSTIFIFGFLAIYIITQTLMTITEDQHGKI